MQDRQLRIAVVLASLLAVALLLRFAWKPVEDDIDPDATAPIWTVKAADVVKVEVERPAGRLVFEKKDDDWLLQEPVQDHADSKQIGYLLDELERVEKGVPIPDADPAEFGLGDPPIVRIEATMADGTTKTLDVGEKAPVGWRTYVKAADGSVVAVAGIIGERFQTDPEGLRDTHLVAFDVATVRRVVIEGPDGTLDVHGEGNRWWLEGWTRADNDAVDDLITGLHEVRVDHFVDDPAPEGLEAPTYRVTIDTTVGPVGFEAGGLSETGVLIRSFDGRAGEADPEKLALLGQGPVDVGDSNAFPLKVDEDDEVQVDLGGQSWSGTRGPDGWTIEGLAPEFARPAITEVAEIPIRYQREPGPALSSVWGTVTVRRGEEAERIVDIGQIVNGNYRTAKDRDGGQAYLVPKDALDAVAVPPPTRPTGE